MGRKPVYAEQTIRLNGPIRMEKVTRIVEPCPLVVIWWYQLDKQQNEKPCLKLTEAENEVVHDSKWS